MSNPRNSSGLPIVDKETADEIVGIAGKNNNAQRLFQPNTPELNAIKSEQTELLRIVDSCIEIFIKLFIKSVPDKEQISNMFKCLGHAVLILTYNSLKKQNIKNKKQRGE